MRDVTDYRNKRILISGGAGVIGTALVQKLLAVGAQLWVGDLQPKPADWPAAIHYWQGDLNTIDADTLNTFSPEVYFHLAATFERSTESPEFWEENFHHNVQLSHHLMTCLKNSPTLKRVVFASSYLVYDPHQYQSESPASVAINLSETSTLHPLNLCGMAKLMHEQELHFLSELPGTRFTAVSARIYRSTGKQSRDVISRWIRDLLQDKPITVYAPQGMFDYIYADDVAEGLLQLGLSDATGPVNLGCGQARRVSEVVEILRQHFPNLVAREGESNIQFEASQADMTALEAHTGWHPLHTLETLIPEMIAYERAHLPARV